MATICQRDLCRMMLQLGWEDKTKGGSGHRILYKEGVLISFHSDLSPDASPEQIQKVCKVEKVEGLKGLIQKIDKIGGEERGRQAKVVGLETTTVVHQQEKVTFSEVAENGQEIVIKIQIPHKWQELIEDALLNLATLPGGSPIDIGRLAAEIIKSIGPIIRGQVKPLVAAEVAAKLKKARRTSSRPQLTLKEWSQRWIEFRAGQLPRSKISGLLKYLKREGIVPQNERGMERLLRKCGPSIDNYFGSADAPAQG